MAVATMHSWGSPSTCHAPPGYAGCSGVSSIDAILVMTWSRRPRNDNPPPAAAAGPPSAGTPSPPFPNRAGPSGGSGRGTARWPLNAASAKPSRFRCSTSAGMVANMAVFHAAWSAKRRRSFETLPPTVPWLMTITGGGCATAMLIAVVAPADAAAASSRLASRGPASGCGAGYRSSSAWNSQNRVAPPPSSLGASPYHDSSSSWLAHKSAWSGPPWTLWASLGCVSVRTRSNSGTTAVRASSAAE
mmetsp:Transcript_4840/g.12420  ORF Transcript_4840/g.12420 Transcript_4840/m.12420 type:complete len:246 (+) Transcript_4840:677-1414(+)